MNDKKYLSIIRACEAGLAKHGDTFLGVGWTKKKEYADLRYKVMLEVIKPDICREVSLLDYMLQHNIHNVDYSGLDLSKQFVDLSRSKFPYIRYYHLDVLCDDLELP